MWTVIFGPKVKFSLSTEDTKIQIVDFGVHAKIQIPDFGVHITKTQDYGQWSSVPKFNIPLWTLQINKLWG